MSVQVSAGQCMSVHVSACQCRSVQVSAGQYRSVLVSAGQYLSVQVSAGQCRSVPGYKGTHFELGLKYMVLILYKESISHGQPLKPGSRGCKPSSTTELFCYLTGRLNKLHPLRTGGASVKDQYVIGFK